MIGVDYAASSLSWCGDSSSPHERRCRLGIVVAIASVITIGIVARLISLQITHGASWQETALRQHLTKQRVLSSRGQILDARGRLLATSVSAGSVFAHPHQIQDKEKAAIVIAKALELDKRTVAAELGKKAPFVWVARQVPLSVAEAVGEAGIKGVGYVVESRRFYPLGSSGSTLLGKVGVDGEGLSGLERLYDSELRGEDKTEWVARDAHGNLIHPGAGIDEDLGVPKGAPIQLTIDSELQRVLDEELERGRSNAKAKAAIGLLVDSATGEILATGQSPAANFNTMKVKSREALKNLVAETTFEPGSTMKPLVAAAALEERVIRETDYLNCEHGRYRFGRHTIKDVHPLNFVPFHDVVVQSSNIGMSKVGERLGAERLHTYLRTFGFGRRTPLELPGESPGILRDVKGWAKVDVLTHSFGQGVAVTALQMTRAFSALANGGILPPLRLRRDEPPADSGVRVLSPETVEIVRGMLRDVVESKHGTAHNAQIPGVFVAGKTGTAQKARVGGRGYQSGAYFASFVGFADAREYKLPRVLTLFVGVDEPRGGSIYGGTVAAPIFRQVISRSLEILSRRRDFSHRRDMTRFPSQPELSPASYVW